MASDNEMVAENCSGRQDPETTFADAIAAIGKDVNTSFQNCPTKDLDVVIMPIGGIWADIKAIEAAHNREVAELKHMIKSAARWIKCHDIYHTSGDDLLKQAKKILKDDGEFLFKKEEE